MLGILCFSMRVTFFKSLTFIFKRFFPTVTVRKALVILYLLKLTLFIIKREFWINLKKN